MRKVNAMEIPSRILGLTPPTFRTRISSRGKLVVWWTCTSCGFSLSKTQWICKAEGIIVRDRRALHLARDQHRQAQRDFDLARAQEKTRAMTVILPRSRVEGRRADCPVCGRGVALAWSRCDYCGVQIERAA
jgi:hypothetical protein